MQEPILRSCILPSFEQDSVMAVDIARLQEDENWNRMLLKYIFNSRPIWKQGIAWASGTTRKRISRKNIEKLRLPTPPLSEQRQIATVLHTVDQAIQKTGEIIEQTKSVRQGLKQDLLTGQKRSNEYKYVNLEPAEVKMPFEWDVVSLSHVTNNITEMPHRMPEKVEEGIPFITTGDISEDADIDLDSVERISEEDYRELSKSFDAEQGDILYTRYGTIGIAKEVDFNPKFIASYSVALLKPNQEVDPTFLTIQLNSWLSQKQAASRTTQSANKNFDLERIPKLNIVLPDKESQIEIARIISEVNGTISENKKYLQQLKRLKRGLMQDLLSGEVRTTDVDIDVPQEVAKYA
jgi:type I restriction enzyme S subunit